MNRELQLDQQSLVSAWQERLPALMEDGDSFSVQGDAADPSSLLVHFNAAGRQAYSLDFRCTYVDSREVAVSLIDAEEAGRQTDERSDAVQLLAQRYTRQIHECAQALQDLTNP
ncbi:hypothetical protein JI735_09085 [Paenibacillus sonchi]|jgi:hypothetical protein|uniref:Uncharacterized protein n=5 Tax=Paenibacillus TaxID=44249 RepID=A0A089M467_9BACL|nr:MULTISPECIES: hypothetical protein [Paenibacillus]AIQ66293.1 hypothetical protein PGRAT_00440 [Paenibacillus graminis]KWX79393.1 hypothetical protein AML91_03005 [Paenibacillus jilunlii]KWX80794.1 hypothetical protein AMQ84_02310 [Paenibacillus riograndensis]KWX83813.1 hypothetical protein AMQ83_30490 [Paenibacillus riograndensis]MCE3198094.1 hypothetical protein [Paenibacillus sonchi]